ncbi:DCC-interacting protein 13-alpha-like isoform X2 [Anneissia japonica]|uniref:DCC-interacting protein 13-alpha-like isoform X2 n=1 Tax=Anneissia japonica TaxID=1529436 RepID=UPI001425B9DB|nr:DCC-interacting protein 13-alpha-like isoform X2 [Anneissia japonica]
MEGLRLEDVQEDSPQSRYLLGLFEEDSAMLAKYVKGLHESCRKILDCQNSLCAAMQDLSAKAMEFERWKFPIERDDSVLCSTMKQLAMTVNDISSVYTVLSTQVSEGVFQRLSSFLNGDIADITSLQEVYHQLDQEHEQVLSKYCKISKKKENETKARIESTDELCNVRKKLMQSGLNLYTGLNLLQHKRKTTLIETLVVYLQSQISFFKLGKEMLSNQTTEFLANSVASTHEVHNAMARTAESCQEKIESIQANSTYYFTPDPTPDMQTPARKIRTNLRQTSSFLFIRHKHGLTHRWEKEYFFTQGTNLMSQAKGEIAGSLVVDLENCTVNHVDVDDRRYVFQITSPVDTKKTITLQALSGSDREEWMATIRNLSSGFHTQQPPVLSEVPTGSVPSRPQKIPVLHDQDTQRVDTHQGSKGSSKDLPATPPPSPLEVVLPTTPIQFDMISPVERHAPPVNRSQAKDGPPRRINPFCEPSADGRDDSVPYGSTFSQMYTIRFLGSVEIKGDRGVELVNETIRQIMAARAIHNVFRMSESHMIITSERVRLLDTSSQAIKADFDLRDISFWAAHQENKRLFAFITRSKFSKGRGHHKFTCYVFESDISSENICKSLSDATGLAFNKMLERKTSESQDIS